MSLGRTALGFNGIFRVAIDIGIRLEDDSSRAVCLIGLGDLAASIRKTFKHTYHLSIPRLDLSPGWKLMKYQSPHSFHRMLMGLLRKELNSTTAGSNYKIAD